MTTAPGTLYVTVLPSQAEQDVREFARQFPTQQVLRALAMCESGRLPWANVSHICADALAKGIQAVQA
jgi:hypothetical protein